MICLLVTYLVTFGLGAQLLAIGVFVRSFGIQEELACYFFSLSLFFLFIFFSTLGVLSMVDYFSQVKQENLNNSKR